MVEKLLGFLGIRKENKTETQELSGEGQLREPSPQQKKTDQEETGGHGEGPIPYFDNSDPKN